MNRLLNDCEIDEHIYHNTSYIILTFILLNCALPTSSIRYPLILKYTLEIVQILSSMPHVHSFIYRFGLGAK